MCQDKTSILNIQMPSKADVVRIARSWLEVQWVHQGRTRKGIDCAGLIVMVARELKLSDYDVQGYPRRPKEYSFMQHFDGPMRKKRIAEAEPGDVLLFRDGRFPCHATVVGEDDGELTIIHALASARKVKEEVLTQGDWLQRRIACFEFKGLK